MMKYAAKVYVMSDGKTVQVFQTQNDGQSPIYTPSSMQFKTAGINDAAKIGELVQAAVQGRLNE